MAASSVIANLKIQLSASWQGLRSDFAKAGKSVQGFGRQVNGSMSLGQKSVGGLTRVLGGLKGMLVQVAQMLFKFTAIGMLLSAGAFVSWGVKLAAEAETAHVALSTLLQSGEHATEVMRQLQDFAASTPFQLNELVEGGKKLAAFGTAAGDIVPTMRMLGDLAAGIGAPVGELAEIFGKAKVQGRLMAEDINQLLGRGIPVVQALADTMGVTTEEVRGLVSAGNVGFAELRTALEHLTGEGSQFGGMMAKQSQTLNGLWSTLKDNIGAYFREVGELLAPLLKWVLKASIQIVDANRRMFRNIKELFGIKGEPVLKIQLPMDEIESMKHITDDMGDSLASGAESIRDSALDMQEIIRDVDKMMARSPVAALDRRSSAGFQAVHSAKQIQDSRDDRLLEIQKRILAALEEANELKRKQKAVEVTRKRV